MHPSVMIDETWNLTAFHLDVRFFPVDGFSELSGAITRYKARWVVKGFRHVEGVDFDKTFASVVKWALWRALLGLGVKEN